MGAEARAPTRYRQVLCIAEHLSGVTLLGRRSPFVRQHGSCSPLIVAAPRETPFVSNFSSSAQPRQPLCAPFSGSESVPALAVFGEHTPALLLPTD